MAIGAHGTAALTTDHPRDLIVRALEAAGARLALVDSDGVEHPDPQTMADEAAGLHTPSWVALLTDDERPYLYVDCEGAIPEPMGATMRRILREELTRHLDGAQAEPL